MSETNKVMEKIRGLLAKAESTEFEDERYALLDKATELMAKHRISESAVVDASQQNDDKLGRVDVELGVWPVPKGTLLVGLARTFNCHVGRVDKKKLFVIGYDSDMQMVNTLFTSLVIQLDRELSKIEAGSTGETRAHRSSFAKAFCAKVNRRVREHYSQSIQENLDSADSRTRMDLVLVNRDEATAAYFAEVTGSGPRYVKAANKYSRRSSVEAGTRAAERADIGMGGIGGGRRALNA